MKVMAKGNVGTVVGYYDNRKVLAGTVFEISDEKVEKVVDGKKVKVVKEFSDIWMEAVEAETKTVVKEEKPREAVPLSAGNKAVHAGKIEKKEPVAKKESKSTGDKDVI